MKIAKIKVSKNGTLAAVLSCIYMIIIASIEIFTQFIPYREQQVLILTLSVITYGCICCALYLQDKKITIFFVFVVISYPFAFGTHIVELLGGENIYNTNLSLHSIELAGYWNIYAIVAIFAGYMLARRNDRGNRIGNKIVYTSRGLNADFQLVAWLALIISALPYLMDTLQAITITVEQGYGYRIVENSNTVSLQGVLSGFFIPSAVALVLFGKRVGYIALLLGLGLQVVSGTRIATFCYLLVLGFWLVSNERSVEKRRKLIVRTLIVIVVVAILFSFVSYDRNALASIRSLQDAGKYFADYINHNSIFERVLRETGWSFQVSACVMQNCPEPVEYIYGYSYLYSLIYVIPNFITNSIFPICVNTDIAFAGFLTQYGGIGSSFSAEAYYNFGYFGIIWLSVIGVLWRKLSNYMEYAIKSNDIIRIFLSLEIAKQMIFMVRNDMVYCLRAIVWTGCFMVLLAIVFNKIANKKRQFRS